MLATHDSVVRLLYCKNFLESLKKESFTRCSRRWVKKLLCLFVLSSSLIHHGCVFCRRWCDIFFALCQCSVWWLTLDGFLRPLDGLRALSLPCQCAIIVPIKQRHFGFVPTGISMEGESIFASVCPSASPSVDIHQAVSEKGKTYRTGT